MSLIAIPELNNELNPRHFFKFTSDGQVAFLIRYQDPCIIQRIDLITNAVTAIKMPEKHVWITGFALHPCAPQPGSLGYLTAVGANTLSRWDHWPGSYPRAPSVPFVS